MTVTADLLPSDVLLEIFSYLSRDDLVNSVQFVCTWWQEVSRDRSLWNSIVYTPCESSKEVIKVLGLSPELRNLDLESVHVNTSLVQYITDCCPNLEYIKMAWDSITNDPNVDITRPITQVKKLFLVCKIEPIIDLTYVERCFPNLEHFYMNVLQCRLRDLKVYLLKQHSLRTLGISCRTYEDHCVLPSLANAKNLKELLLNGVCDKVEMLLPKDLKHLGNISSLTINFAVVSTNIGNQSLFSVFHNIETLELNGCAQFSREDILRVIAYSCPRLQKLLVSYQYDYFGNLEILQDATSKYICHFKQLTHLSIYGSSYVTEISLPYVRLIPKLTHLDLYKCDRLAITSLKTICGFSKLKVIKFDLKCGNPPGDFSESDVKNKDIQIWFYNCKDVFSLNSLREQYLRVGICKEPVMRYMSID